MGVPEAVYVMTDLEGVAGVDDWDPRHRDYGSEAKGVFERSEVQRLLTGEVNAAVEGLFEAGVEHVLINDAHGAGRTILPEELVSGVRIVRGLNRPCWLPGLTRRFGALVQVGMHAMGYTPNACLAHSMSKGIKYRVNDREVGEMEMAGFLVGEIGIPWVFTSGDGHACRESEAWVPGIVTVPVKEGISELSAIHMAPTDARTAIRDQVMTSVERAAEIKPIVPGGAIVMEVEQEQPFPARIREGAERIDGFTIQFKGDSFWSVFHQCFYGRPDFPLPE